MQIEQDTDRVHNHHAQQAIAQMPDITRPNSFDSAAISQLSEDGIDAIADSSEHCAPTVRGLRTGFAKRS